MPTKAILLVLAHGLTLGFCFAASEGPGSRDDLQPQESKNVTPLVRLKNGALADGELVKQTYERLMALHGIGWDLSGNVAFYALVQKARDRTYSLPFDLANTLQEQGFIEIDPETRETQLDANIRNIILSSAEGSGLELRMVHPFMGSGCNENFGDIIDQKTSGSEGPG